MSSLLTCLTVGVFLTTLTISTALIERRSILSRTALSEGTGPNGTLIASTEEETSLPTDTAKAPTARQVYHKRDSRNRCPFISPKIELALVFDEVLCSRFDNDLKRVHEFLKSIVLDAQRILNPKTCLTIEIVVFATSCPSHASYRPNDSYNITNVLKDCSISSCPSQILSSLRKGWEKDGSFYEKYDLVLLVAGSDDGTGTSGAAYVGTVCDSHRGFVWIEAKLGSPKQAEEGPSPPLSGAILAHEIGHSLNTYHASEGIMNPMISADDKYFLSDSSAKAINEFVARDPRAWCLSRATIGTTSRKDWWTTLRRERPRGHVVDIEMVKRPIRGRHFIYMFSKNGKMVEYSVTELRHCELSHECEFESTGVTHYNTMPSGCSNCQYGTSALRQSTKSTSVAVLVAHTTRGRENSGRISGHFQMSRPAEPGVKGTTTWLEEFQVPDWTGDESIRFERTSRCEYERSLVVGPVVAIGIGAISHSQSTDLVWMYAVEQEGRTFVKYKIGFNLDDNGKVAGRWGEEISVPEWFGKDMNKLRVTLHNVGREDAVDLIISHEDFRAKACSAYYRIGFDLNSTGHVTGGWTNDVDDSHTLQRGLKEVSLLSGPFVGISVTDFTVGTPAIMVASHSYSPATNPHLELRFSEEMLIGLTSERHQSVTESRSATYLCYKCYKEDVASKCANIVEKCAGWTDEVRLDDGTLRVADLKNNTETTQYLTTVVRSQRKRWESISCEGFDHLYRGPGVGVEQGKCDLASPQKVVGFGVLLALKDVLAKQYKGEFELSRENTKVDGQGGRNGKKRKSVATTILVLSKGTGKKRAIRKAIKILKKRYNDYNHIFTANPKVLRVSKGKYRVSFFNKQISKEF